jgi:hypothetical protein
VDAFSVGPEAGMTLRVGFPPGPDPLVADPEFLLFLRPESGRSYYIPAPVMTPRVDSEQAEPIAAPDRETTIR